MSRRFKNWYAPFWGFLALLLSAICFAFFTKLSSASPASVLGGLGGAQVIIALGTWLIARHLDKHHGGEYDSAPAVQMIFAFFVFVMGGIELAGLFDPTSQQDLLQLFVGETVILPAAVALALIGPSVHWVRQWSPTA